MAATQPTTSKRPQKRVDKSITKVVSELWSLTIAYAKQEIKDPLDGLAKTVLWGVVTMFLLGVGSILLAVAGLRALQTETGSAFDGNWSFAPYGIVLLVSAVVLATVFFVVTREKKR